MRLGVNIDHVATLRQARGTAYPDPLRAAVLVTDAGADGITAHLREDRRHIQDRDMERLAWHARIQYLNMEMAASNEMVAICCQLKPQACCLVPEKREELTTEGGLDVAGHQPRLASVVEKLASCNVQVSMFIDPVPAQIRASHAIGAPVVELHTGHYANLRGAAQQQELERLRHGAKLATDLGLTVHAGHGLTCDNTPDIAAIADISELNIGHAIISDALFVGLPQAIANFRRAMAR